MPRKQLPKITMREAIQDFVDTLPTELSATVKRRKKVVLEHLVKHCPKREHTLTRNLREIYFQDCIQDLAQGATDSENEWRRRKGIAARTGRRGKSLKSDRVTLRQFGDHLVYRKWVNPDFNPNYEITHTSRDAGDVDPRRVRQFRRIPLEEWPAFLDAAAHPRDRLMMAFGLWFARRASDLAIMEWRDLDLEAGTVKLFNVKRRKPVANGPLPIWPEIREEITRYLEWFVPRYGEPAPEWPLFPRRLPPAGVPLAERRPGEWPLNPTQAASPVQVGETTRRVLLAYGWRKEDMLGEGGHTLRRSGLDGVSELGDDTMAQLLAGHVNLSQTLHYTAQSRQRRELSALMAKGVGTRSIPIPEQTEQKEPETGPQTGDTIAPVVDLWSRRRVA